MPGALLATLSFDIPRYLRAFFSSPGEMPCRSEGAAHVESWYPMGYRWSHAQMSGQTKVPVGFSFCFILKVNIIDKALLHQLIKDNLTHNSGKKKIFFFQFRSRSFNGTLKLWDCLLFFQAFSSEFLVLPLLKFRTVSFGAISFLLVIQGDFIHFVFFVQLLWQINS